VTSDRRFRFGVHLATAASGQEWADSARKVEALGYSTLCIPDHFEDQLGPVPALMAAADATSELRIGALVFANDYRHPVVLAKELASLDVLSEGRLEVGLGAGWMATDYEKSGIPHDPAKVRIDRMKEGIAVIKGLFADGAFSFEGEHYTVSDLDGTPKPFQRPSPPWLIGGGGKRVLSIAAREADIVGINPAVVTGVADESAAADTTAAATDRKIDWVRAAAGDRFDDIELNMLVYAAVETDDRAGFAELIGGGFGVSSDDALDIPHAWFGSIDEICESLEERRQRWGLSYYVLQGDTYEAMAPVVDRLAGT
jgi:probable F420-dependent oxidoreductase